VIDRSSPLPLWAQVLEDLRARMGIGEFAERFPTDSELVERYGVSRQTVREAVRRLSDEGMLERTRGRGTRLRDFQQIGGSLESLYEQIEAQGAAQRSIVRERERVSNPEIARRLELSARIPLVHIERLRLADEQPLALDRAWLPLAVAGELLTADLSHSGIYVELLRANDVDVDAGSEQIKPVIPAASDRKTLKLPRGEATFSIQRLTRSAGRPVEWRHSLVRGDRYTINLELSRERKRSPRLPWMPADAA